MINTKECTHTRKILIFFNEARLMDDQSSELIILFPATMSDNIFQACLMLRKHEEAMNIVI